jgi:hypothetical protein
MKLVIGNRLFRAKFHVEQLNKQDALLITLPSHKEAHRGSPGRWSTVARKSGIFEGNIPRLPQVSRDGKGIMGSGTAKSLEARRIECEFRDGF